MSRYRTILFDLDGTLIDTRKGIMNCLRHTFDTLGLPQPDDADRFLGPPLPYSFREFCGMNEEETSEAVRIFREKYSRDELFNAEVFGGITELLDALKDRGYVLAVATCKIEKYAHLILDRFGISRYFKVIGGSAGTRVTKEEVIAHVRSELGDPDISQMLMIGDRDNDILGAKAVGIGCLYALWGYGSFAEACKYGASAAVGTPMDCLGYIEAQ